MKKTISYIALAILMLAIAIPIGIMAGNDSARPSDLCDNPQPGPYPYPVSCTGAPPPPGLCLSWRTWGNPQFNPGWYFVPDEQFVCRVYVKDTAWIINFFHGGGRDQCLLGVCVSNMSGEWVKVSSTRHIEQITIYTQSYYQNYLPVVER